MWTGVDGLDEGLDLRVRWCVGSVKRMVRGRLMEVLRGMQADEDLRQTVLLAAVESWRRGEGIKETGRRVQREVYRMLVELGFKRGRGSDGFYRREGEFSKELEGVVYGIVDEEDN